MSEPTVVDSEPETQSTGHIVHLLMQFALAVRYRRNVLIGAMLIAGLLGGLYFATATRYYSAEASLLVMQTGNDLMDPAATNSTASRQGLMPTYENLITSPAVLEGALKLLPRQHRVDLVDVPRERWAHVLRENLSAQTIRFTNIIEIEYRSKDPGAAVSVINAVVDSYLSFMDRTHKGTAVEIIDVLKREKVKLADDLAAKEADLEGARQEAGDLATGAEDKLLHPMMQRVVSFNDALIETREERIKLQATLAAVDVSIRNGEGLQQHVMAVAEAVGQEILRGTLNINDRNAATQMAMERDLLEFKARLGAMEEHWGPRHPDVLALREQIRQTQEYLLRYPERVMERLTEIQENRLGPMLQEMLRQKLTETWQLELSLQEEYDRALAEASGLSGQLSRIDIISHEVGRLRQLHDLLLDRIASIDIKHEGPDILVTPLNEPTEANSPVSPSAARVLLLVLLLGTAVGLTGVYVLDILDDRFRSLEEMQRQLGAPVLAMVRRLESEHRTGVESLQVYSQADAAESEAFRTLRTALSLASEASSRLVITSAEPGDGKTTILGNLAVAYAQSGKRTLIIDADLRRPGLTTMLGLRGVDGLSTVIRGHDDLVKTAAMHVRASGVNGLDVLPSGPRPANPAELLASARFSELLAWAETVYEHVLIDSPPALATSDAAVIGRLVDGVILVVQPQKNRRRSVLRATETFTTLKITLLGVVINRVDNETTADYYGYGGGYAYQYGYGADDEDDDAVIDGAEESAVVVDQYETPASEAAVGIVPRRIVRQPDSSHTS